MKKIFNLIFISVAALMLSGCLISFDGFEYEEDWDSGSSGSYSASYYDFTFCNNTSKTVTDWFIQDKNGNNTALSTGHLCPCYSNSSSTMMNVKEKTYTVYFSYESSPDEYDYYVSEFWFDLDKDVTYYLRSDSYASRGLEDSAEENLYIEDSEGNRYELKKAGSVKRFQ